MRNMLHLLDKPLHSQKVTVQAVSKMVHPECNSFTYKIYMFGDQIELSCIIIITKGVYSLLI